MLVGDDDATRGRGLRGSVRDLPAVEQDAACVRTDLAGDDPRERGLAEPVGPEQPERPPGPRFQRRLLECHGAAEPLGDAVRGQQAHGAI